MFGCWVMVVVGRQVRELLYAVRAVDKATEDMNSGLVRFFALLFLLQVQLLLYRSCCCIAVVVVLHLLLYCSCCCIAVVVVVVAVAVVVVVVFVVVVVVDDDYDDPARPCSCKARKMSHNEGREGQNECQTDG